MDIIISRKKKHYIKLYNYLNTFIKWTLLYQEKKILYQIIQLFEYIYYIKKKTLDLLLYYKIHYYFYYLIIKRITKTL